MKTKSRLLFLLCFALFIINPGLLYSQVLDEQPGHAVSRTRFSETPFALSQPARVNNPLITSLVAEVNADTLHKTLWQLQNWGSRCALNENHKDVAIWLMNKFLSYGYTDVKLDSFYTVLNIRNIYIDTSWQYNIVCTLHGSSAPDEIYVIGGHYDSFSFDDPYNDAPGVDDNGTGTAATLEMARVMAKMNFHPETTIQFMLFAAEEFGLLGSQYIAQKALFEEKDIRCMYAMDMISYNPDNLNEMVIDDYPNYEWAGHVAAEAIERYTDLSVSFGIDLREGTDSYSFWYEGFPSLSCWEVSLCPYIHSPADTLGNCNVPYLTKITSGILAALTEQQFFPSPCNLNAHPTKADVTLRWKPTNNSHIIGYNIYRSDTTGSQYQKISPTTVSDSIYHDLTVEPNKQYYYVLTTVNDSLQESGFSQEVTGIRYNFSDTLLVLANLKGSETTPDSVFAFYQAALNTIPFVWYDINATHKVNPVILSRYHSILWMSNTSYFEVMDNQVKQDISDFIANGGNLLFAGFNPTRFWMNSNVYPLKTPETELFHQFFKVDSVNRAYLCMMFRANAVFPGYDTLNVDTLKYMDLHYPGQIFNLEVFSPLPEANVIYRLDSKYNSNSNLGKMKNKPVGIEYMGDDFKSILLSFPLYYMDTSDAREFLHYVMTEKFNQPVGIEPTPLPEAFDLHIYPNPVTDACNVNFTLIKPGRVKLTLMSMQGQLLNTLIDSNLEQGSHWLRFKIGTQALGLYQIMLQSNEGRVVRKIIKIR